MQVRYDAARCCCARPQPDDPCPCLDGTLISSKSIHISGVIIRPAYDFPLADVNMSWPSVWDDPTNPDTCSILKPFFENRFARTTTFEINLLFTRLEFLPHQDLDKPIQLSAGVKAVILLTQSDAAFGLGQRWNVRTTAVFEEVLTDVDGFVDCDADLTDLAFVSQFDRIPFGSPPDGPNTMDATTATVSYS